MIALLSAPTNLGLRPPEPGGTPGTVKAPEALREAGLHRALLSSGAVDAGAVLPGRYVDDDGRRAAGRVRNHDAIVDHARRLAARLDAVRADGRAPLVLGGDCSLVVAVGLHGPRDAERGLIHIDGHTDFRHPAISDQCASLAGEDLAAAIGLHWPDVSDLDGRAPYFAPAHVAHLGCRDDDPDLGRVRQAIGVALTSQDIDAQGTASAASAAAAVADAAGRGYWLHLDADALDAAIMPAVDSPGARGLGADTLTDLLQRLAPRAVGASVACFDPDLDPDGAAARLLVDILVRGLQEMGSAL